MSVAPTDALGRPRVAHRTFGGDWGGVFRYHYSLTRRAQGEWITTIPRTGSITSKEALSEALGY